jgi:nucleoside-diphosphate-sugar epimerase
VAVLGGTRFVGRAITEELIRAGHRVLLVHRGANGCDVFPSAGHLHTDRARLHLSADRVAAFAPQVVVDVSGMAADDVTSVRPVFARCEKVVVISSCDVYEAYLSYRRGTATQVGPIRETSAVRGERRVLPHAVPGRPQYDKLDVEDAWRDLPMVTLRATAVYGPYDYLAREAFVVDRVKAGRLDIPAGPATLQYTRVSSTELAVGVRLAVESDETVHGETFNLAEPETLSVGQWAEAIAEALGARIRLVRVPDEVLPADLRITAEHRQNLVVAADKARAALGWGPAAVGRRIAESAQWHAARRPVRTDFAADDQALVRASSDRPVVMSASGSCPWPPR